MGARLEMSGSSKESVELSDIVFGSDYNEPLVHQVVTAFLARRRSGSKAQKNRSEVSGGGAKPWRQKGTGRARAGTTRSPIWRGGGRTFAAKPRSFSQKVNKKMYRKAICSIFSELLRDERLILVKEFISVEPRTREVKKNLTGLGVNDCLIITKEVDQNLYLACRNIPRVDVIDTVSIDPVLLLSYEKVILTKAALSEIEGYLK